MNVFENGGQWQRQIVIAEAFVHLQPRSLAGLEDAGVDAIVQASLKGLALKAVHHGLYGFGLEGLYFESEFHG
jgi:hypothetical protein